jgi:hypothetical protein
VSSFGSPVEIDEFGIRPLCPASRGIIDLVREGAHSNRNRDIFDVEVAALVFPIETACRNRRVRQPEELVGAKIKDLEFKDKGYNQKFAYLWVTGKSGQRIKKLLVKSLPYLRDWLSSQGHPRTEDPNAYIFCGHGKRNLGHKLKRHTFTHKYIRYRRVLFPSLLNSPEVPEEDKQIIKEKILTKPIKPYVLRHTSLTEKAQIIGEYELRQHADWTTTSNMPQRYLHFAGNESIKAQLKAQGIISNEESTESAEPTTALRPPLICTNCKEQNKPESKFCSNPACGMVLKFEAHIETIRESEKMRKELEELKARQQVDMEQIKAQLANTNDQVSLLLQTLSKIKKYGAKSGTYAETDFVLQKLGVLTNGEIGEDPNSGGVVVEPLD